MFGFTLGLCAIWSLVLDYPSSIGYGFLLLECALSQIRHWLATPMSSMPRLLLHVLGTLSPLFGYYVQLLYDSLCLLYLTLFYFVMLGFCLLEACAFVMRDRKGVDLERKGGGEEGRNWKERREGKL